MHPTTTRARGACGCGGGHSGWLQDLEGEGIRCGTGAPSVRDSEAMDERKACKCWGPSWVLCVLIFGIVVRPND